MSQTKGSSGGQQEHSTLPELLRPHFYLTLVDFRVISSSSPPRATTNRSLRRGVSSKMTQGIVAPDGTRFDLEPCAHLTSTRGTDQLEAGEYQFIAHSPLGY